MLNLTRIILIDHHAHSLLIDFSQLDAIGFRQSFSESNSLSMLNDHSQHSIHYMHMLRLLSEYLDIEEEEEKILEMRSKLGRNDYVSMLFDDASIGGVIVDTGFRRSDMLTPGAFAELSERPIHQCIRIESVYEETFTKSDSFQQMRDSFVRGLTDSNNGPKVVALKTIAAYRGGLEIDSVDVESARKNFAELKKSTDSHATFKAYRSALYHFMLADAFAVAEQENLPLQIHSGLGDADADLRLSNPWCFRSILESRKYARVKFVFLHCYPYVREAALLASLYSNVYMDLSLGMTLISSQASNLFADALAAAPSTKILLATDGHSVPETFWYASHSARTGLAAVLAYLIGNGFVSERQASDIAERLFHRNALELYRLSDI